MRATSTAREQRRRRRRWEDEKKKKEEEEEEERSGTRYEEEEEEVKGGKESATTTVSTPRMGYESVQRRLVEWKKERRKEQRRTEEEEEEEEKDGGEVSIEMQKKKKEREEEDAKKRRSQTTREEEKRAREEYLEQAPWKSPRLTARSARRRQKIEDDERRTKRCERKETVMSTPNAAEIYAKRCEEMCVRVSSRVLKALESETNGGTFDVSKEPLGDGGARAVASAIEEGKAQNESLIFAKCQVGMNGFRAICECALKVSKTFNLLKVLDLSDSIGVNCTFEDDQNLCNSKPSAAVALLPSVFYQLLERLKVLKLNRCEIKGSIVKAIADALVSPKCTIEILELSRNALGNRGAKKIGDALITNRTLKKLDVSLNDISSRGGVSIANAARQNLTLKELNISWNAIGDIGGKALGEALGSNRALRTLDISQCAIGEDATCAISEGLRKNTTLKVLKMDHTRCGETGGKKLMAMLTRNDCLTTLTLEGASFAGAIKVEDKGRQRQSRATKTADSSALKPSTRGNKQEKQQLNHQKKGKTSKARNELKNSTRMGDVYENTNTASSSSSEEESDDNHDSADEDLFNISAVENEKHEQVLRTPRGSARNSNTTAPLASEKLPLSELILPSWATSENSRARQTSIDEEDLLNLLQQLRSNRLSDFERVSRLQMVRSAYLFTSAQVARLTQTFFLPSSHRLAAAAACQPRLIDSENAIDVIYLKNGFGFRDYASANRKLEMLYGERNSQFRSQNPNGRYRFDLGIDADRALAQRMADIANEESSNQRFGGKCWRNVSVDDGPCAIESMCEKGTGIPKVFFSTPSSSSSSSLNEKRRKRTKTLKLPERGTVTFDYSSVVVYVDDNKRHDDNDVDDDYSILKLVRDVENVKTYLFDDNGVYEENANKNDGELYSSNIRTLRAKACTLWFHPTAVKKLIFYFPKGAFRVEAIVALFGRIPLHLRDDFSRDVFSLGHLSGIEQCVLGSRLGWRSVLGTHMDKLTFRCRLDCTREEDLNVAKYLCEKASEANADAHCRVRNVLVNDRRLAKDPVQDVSLLSVLTAESSTPLLEFDYFGEDEGILRELLERELASAVQNGSASARGREQSSLATTKKESSFNLQLRKLGNKLNFSRACEVHRWRKNNAVDTNIERSKVAEKNSSNIAADGAKKKLKSKAKQKKKTKKKAASAPPSLSLPPPSCSLSSPTLRGGNPYETFYASYFLPSFESNTNVLKNIFSSLDQDGGGTLSLYEFKKGATDVLGVKIDRKILEPYFSAVAEQQRQQQQQQQQQQGGENNNNTKIDFRAFQEGVVEYDTFEKICSEWMDDEEAKEKERNVY